MPVRSLHVAHNTVTSWERGERTMSVQRFVNYCSAIDVDPRLVFAAIARSTPEEEPDSTDS